MIVGLAVSALMFATSPTFAKAQNAALLTGVIVQVDGLKTNDGVVICDLFNGEAGFPNKPARALLRTRARPDAMRAMCAFPQAAAGRYAVAVFHDVDGDLKLKTNCIGIPREPVGGGVTGVAAFSARRYRRWRGLRR